MDKIAALTAILESNPKDAFARYGLAMEYANQGQTETALAQFDQLINAHPDYTPGYQMAGQLLAKAGRTEEASQLLRDGITCAQRNGNLHAKSEMEALLDEITS